MASQTTADKEEVQEMIQQQAAVEQVLKSVHKITDVCWDVCMDKPKDSLSSKQQTCFQNCTGRFIDTSLFIQQRMAQMGAANQSGF